jgi:hypothetical protein
MTPIIGFAPDAEQTFIGVLSDCTNLIPSLNGMKGGPSPVTPSDVPALADPCLGAGVVTKLDGTRRIFAGTAGAIYELAGGVWADRSDVGGYTGSPDTQWSITQFGDSTLMANRSEAIQRSTTGAFAAISDAPKAEVVFSVGSFVMALNVNDGSEKPDGWHCCGAFDDTTWTPSTTTQATSGRLVSTPGELTAGGRLGEYAVAYKYRAIYVGQYVGVPAVWDWVQIQGGNAGCVGKNAWCDVNGTHFLVGEDNFWLFDGSRPVPLADGVLREWFSTNSSPEFKYKAVCTFDKKNNNVWVFYPSTNSSTLDSALVFNIQSKRWGRANRDIQAALEYVTQGLTIDGLDTLSSTISGLPDIPFDSPFWLSGGRSLSIFNTSNQLQSLEGVSASSSMTTGDVGDDDSVSLLQQIRLRYAVAPTSATYQTFKKMNSGGAYSADSSGSMNDGKFDALVSARWHKAEISFVGPVTVTHMNAKFKSAGIR